MASRNEPEAVATAKRCLVARHRTATCDQPTRAQLAMYDLSSAAVRSSDASIDAFSSFQYWKRKPAVGLMLLRWR
jgi:hypothetical protein